MVTVSELYHAPTVSYSKVILRNLWSYRNEALTYRFPNMFLFFLYLHSFLRNRYFSLYFSKSLIIVRGASTRVFTALGETKEE